MLSLVVDSTTALLVVHHLKKSTRILKKSTRIQGTRKEASKSMRSKSEPLFDDPQTLPLFRPEALAAQQKKRYGDVLRIHPFSPAFFAVLIVIVFFCLLGIYEFGRTLL